MRPRNILGVELLGCSTPILLLHHGLFTAIILVSSASGPRVRGCIRAFGHFRPHPESVRLEKSPLKSPLTLGVRLEKTPLKSPLTLGVRLEKSPLMLSVRLDKSPPNVNIRCTAREIAPNVRRTAREIAP